MKRKARTNKRTTKTATRARQSTKERIPIAEHLRELKRRIMYVAVSVVAMSAIVYAFEGKVIDILLRPSHGQHFVYTSPLGGINFIFNVSFVFGIALSIPVIMYQLLKFLQPLIKDATQRFIVIISATSGLLALAGILFGYFAGLPAALHFLLRQQFHNGQVEAMISIQSYFSFVVAYMFGAALMLQLPLLLIIFNRIRPLTPKMMFKYERIVIAFSFIIAFIMNPTPNVIDQMLTVVPVLLSYQVGILVVWLINRRDVRRKYGDLFAKDAEARETRAQQAKQAQTVPTEQLEPAPPIPSLKNSGAAPTSQPRQVSPQYIAPRPQYAQGRDQLLQL
ncbi:twin-arginine translocase subunit TatC [Candidatus Saccharibacteria bacterium]|nr:twin-arginine translocase subunit TatC [Candidatus Saccharibacteria bacterium]